MGTKSGKEEKKNSSVLKGDQIKDEYVKYLRKNQVRTEKEFKQNAANEKCAYAKVK